MALSLCIMAFTFLCSDVEDTMACRNLATGFFERALAFALAALLCGAANLGFEAKGNAACSFLGTLRAEKRRSFRSTGL